MTDVTSPARRRLQAIAAAMACAALVAGCSSGAVGTQQAATTAKTTITFVSYNYGTPDLGGQGMAQLISEFERAHPGITVKPSGISAADIYPQVQAAAAAGHPPDVAQIGWSKESAALHNLPVVPVSSLAPAGQIAAVERKFVPHALAAGEANGKLMVMPFAMSTPTLFFNASLFQKAGLDPASPPTTWAQAEKDALAIKKATHAQGIAIAADNAAGSDFLTQSLINSNGGRMISPSGQAQLGTPAALGALRLLQHLAGSGASPDVSDNDAVALFKSGKLGMYVTSTALLSTFEAAAQGSFTLKTAAMPGFGAMPAKPTYSGSGLFVFSKDKAKQRADWEFLQFMTSEQGFTTLTEKIGYLPLRTDVVNDPKYLGSYFSSHPLLVPALKQLQNVTPYQQFSGPSSDQARLDIQNDCVTPVMLSHADPATVCPKVGKQVNTLLGSQ